MGHITDAFARADSTTDLGVTDTGQMWRQDHGVWGIYSGHAYTPSSDGSGDLGPVASVDLGDRVQHVSCVEVYDPPTNAMFGVVARLTDEHNYWFAGVYHSPSGGRILLAGKNVAGTVTFNQFGPSTIFLGSVSAPFTIEMAVDDQDRWTVKINGVTYGQPVTDSFNNTATRCGILQLSSGGATFDSFDAVGGLVLPRYSGVVQAMLADGPAALWPFDGGRTGVYGLSDYAAAFKDISGNGYDLVLAGGGFSPGPGQAPLIPGSLMKSLGLVTNGSNYPHRAFDAALDVGAGDFAVEMWFKYTGPLSNYVEFFGRDAGASGNGLIIYGLISTGVARVWCGGVAGNGNINICDGVLHHLVVSRISGIVTVYVDGRPDYSFIASGNTDRSSGTYVGIVDGSYHGFEGSMGPVAYYTHGLTDDQVAAHWRSKRNVALVVG